MDFEDINPLAVAFGIGGAFITVIMARFGGEGISLFWRFLTPVATFFVCYFLTAKMFE